MFKKDRFTIVIGCVSALGAIVALLAYMDNKKHEKLKEEILLLDKQIKEHDLKQRKSTT